MPRVSLADVQRSAKRRVVERVVATVFVVAFFVVGYFGVGLTADPSRARELALPIDGSIPFVPWTVWIYLWVFPASFLPLFVVRCPALFRRTMIAYVVAIACSLVIFVVFPVTSVGLRVDPATLDVKRFSPWTVAVLYELDPPYNLFPSLHLSMAALAASAAWKADRRIGMLTAVGVALVGVSICTVKQHFVLDGLGGLAIAAAIHAIVLRPYRPPRGDPVAYGWPGWASYLVLLVTVFVGSLIAFRLSL
jgi:membrane-associated phospholipid phosphatase